MPTDRLRKYTWAVLAYNLFVIVFGGFVRASGSGAGCGSHWPLCNGVVVPQSPAIHTVIEFTHRITSGLTVVFILVLLVWVWRTQTRGHAARQTSIAAMFFIITESLIGAGLVLFRLVEDNDSVVRAFSMMAHLVNTFLLLASLALTAWFLSFGGRIHVRNLGIHSWLFLVGVLGVFLLGASGAVAALGDTLFPASSLAEGLQQEFSGTAHYLIRLRVLHPPIAITVGLYVVWIGRRLYNRFPSRYSARLSLALLGCVLFQFGLGFLNVWLLAPIWMQLAHLLTTTLIWILYVLTGVSVWVSRYFPASISEEHINDRIDQSAAQQPN